MQLHPDVSVYALFSLAQLLPCFGSLAVQALFSQNTTGVVSFLVWIFLNGEKLTGGFNLSRLEGLSVVSVVPFLSSG